MTTKNDQFPAPLKWYSHPSKCVFPPQKSIITVGFLVLRNIDVKNVLFNKDSKRYYSRRRQWIHKGDNVLNLIKWVCSVAGEVFFKWLLFKWLFVEIWSFKGLFLHHKSFFRILTWTFLTHQTFPFWGTSQGKFLGRFNNMRTGDTF